MAPTANMRRKLTILFGRFLFSPSRCVGEVLKRFAALLAFDHHAGPKTVACLEIANPNREIAGALSLAAIAEILLRRSGPQVILGMVIYVAIFVIYLLRPMARFEKKDDATDHQLPEFPAHRQSHLDVAIGLPGLGCNATAWNETKKTPISNEERIADLLSIFGGERAIFHEVMNNG